MSIKVLSLQMQRLFLHNHDEPQGSFTTTLSGSLVHSITLHPVKSPPFLYRLHSFFLASHSSELRHRVLIKKHLLSNYGEPSLTKFRKRNVKESLSWNFIKRGHMYARNNNNPNFGIYDSDKEFLVRTIGNFLDYINLKSRQRGRRIEFKQIIYGYNTINPKEGVNLILDLLLMYKKHKGRRLNVPVRRHAYLQTPFSDVQSRVLDMNTGKINIIVPLLDRHERLKIFLKKMNKECFNFKEPKIRLLFVLYDGIQLNENRKLIKEYKSKLAGHEILIFEKTGQFSRGSALQDGASAFPPSSLLFFLDIDVLLSRSALQRVLQGTIEGKQVYYPIVFSEYLFKSTDDGLNDSNGLWRQFGFGIASMYKSDFNSVGGFDTKIVGWGKEDVDLYEKFVRTNLTVVRAVDPGMIHVYHDKYCDRNMWNYKMCMGTKFAMYASIKGLANMVLNNTIQKSSWRNNYYDLNVRALRGAR